MIKKCKNCKKSFKTFPCRIGNYCSRGCANSNKPGTFTSGHKWVGKLKACGYRKMSHGYIEIYSPNHPMKNKRNAVLEHRLVMEQKIGRFLNKNEVVHHINSNKSDNRINNLVLIPSQSEHMKHEYKTNTKFRNLLKKTQFNKN